MTHLNYLRQAIDPSFCIYEAWELVKKRLFFYICVSLVMIILPQLPYINYIGFLLNAPLMGGLAYIVLRDTSEEPVNFAMLFKGFEKVLPLIAVALIQVVPVFAFGGVFAFLAGTGALSSGLGGPTSILGSSVSIGLMVMWAIGYIAFAVIWNWALIFAIPLIIEHEVSITDAVKLSLGAAFSNAGQLFCLGLWSFLVALLGLLALLVGIVVALPVIQIAGIMAYRQVFPRVTVRPDMPPPTESIYD